MTVTRVDKARQMYDSRKFAMVEFAASASTR
jgi:hypothetical protein